MAALLASCPLACASHSNEDGSDGTDGLDGADPFDSAPGPDGACPPVPASEFPNVQAWASEVALGFEFGDARKIVRRFVGPVTISMMEGNAIQRSMLEGVVRTLSEVLAETETTVTLTVDGTRSAEMLVWFTPYARFHDVAAAEGFQVFPGNSGQGYVVWNARQALTKAYVLLATDHLRGTELTHFTYEEVTQSLGLGSDSPRYPNSIFFAKGTDGGTAQTLSCNDRELVRLVYTHLKPGDAGAALANAMSMHFDPER